MLNITIREMQIKTTMRHHCTQIRTAIIRKSTNNKCWRGFGEEETLLHYWCKCKPIQPLWRIVWRFLKNLGTELPHDQNCRTTQQCYCWAYILRKSELKEQPRVLWQMNG